MTDDTKHSPLPWFRDRRFQIGPRLDTDDQCNGMLYAIADVFGESQKEDADLIVRAVNAHAQLVAALTQIAAIENKDFGPDWEEIEEARAIAEKALASLKETSS